MITVDTDTPVADEHLELLIFQVADQDYALEIMSVREIRGWTRTTPLPHAPAFMKGVMNLRGTVLPVMDLGVRLGMDAREQSRRNVIIVVSLDGQLTGLLVDAVLDIVTLTPEALQAPPDLSGTDQLSVIRHLCTLEDRMIRILDLHRTIAPSEPAAA